MANLNAAATYWNCPNYVGELYLIGANKTPFLSMIGGLEGGRIRTVSDFQFSLGQPWNLETPSQPAITETASLTAPTPWTYVRDIAQNTCQIFQRAVKVSYAKQSATGAVVANAQGYVDIDGNQPVQNEVDFQIAAHMRQLSADIEFTFLNGVYQAATNAGVAAKCRGIISACVANTVDAANAALSRALFNALVAEMAANGSEFANPVVFCNATQKQKISEIFGYAPADRNVGGVNIKQIETDFAMMGVAYAPLMPSTALLIADLNTCRPVFLPVPGKGVLFYENLDKTGAADSGQIYGQIGLDYGPQENHGTITNLAV